MKYAIPKLSRRRRIKGQANLPADKPSRDYIVDAIMTNAPSGESFRMSLSRLATAAAYAGYETLCPTAVFVCYRIFKDKLTKEFDNGRRTRR